MKKKVKREKKRKRPTGTPDSTISQVETIEARRTEDEFSLDYSPELRQTISDFGDAADEFMDAAVVGAVSGVWAAIRSSKVRSVIIGIQLAEATALNPRIKIPPDYRRWMVSIEFINLKLVNLLPIPCLLRVTHMMRLQFATLFPIAAVSILFFYAKVCQAMRQKPGKSRMWDNMTSVSLLLITVIYTYVSTVVLATIQCETFETGTPGLEKMYLIADYRVACGSDHYQHFLLPYAVLMIFIYPLGVPLMYCTIFYKNRHTLALGKHATIEEIERRPQVFAFLYEPYEPHLYWFELLECLRRLCLSSLTSVYPDKYLTTLVIFFTLLFDRIYAFYMPFVNDSDDYVGEYCQWTLVWIYLFLFLYENYGSFSGIDEILMFFTLSSVPVALFCHYYPQFHSKKEDLPPTPPRDQSQDESCSDSEQGESCSDSNRFCFEYKEDSDDEPDQSEPDRSLGFSSIFCKPKPTSEENLQVVFDARANAMEL